MSSSMIMPVIFVQRSGFVDKVNVEINVDF